MDSVYLAHHGVKGMRWGVRRYQNEDGSFTEAGKARYAKLKSTSSKYDQKATSARALESKYLYKRDRLDSRLIKTSISNARADRFDRKARRKNVKALRYESLSKKYDAKAKSMIARSKADKVKYNEMQAKKSKLTESAVDDYIAVMSGNMTTEQYNRKYAGTGYKIS